MMLIPIAIASVLSGLPACLPLAAPVGMIATLFVLVPADETLNVMSVLPSVDTILDMTIVSVLPEDELIRVSVLVVFCH